jgi:hypothetical protein
LRSIIIGSVRSESGRSFSDARSDAVISV